MADDRERVLNSTVVKLGLVSLLADISSEMLYPITPIFLTSVLGASMAQLGWVEGFAEALASLLKSPLGAWSDRMRWRKPFVVVGYLLTALAKPLVGQSENWWQVCSARGLDRFGKGVRGSPRDALLADAVVPRLRGAAFGWHRGMDTLGAALGPLVALIFLLHHGATDLRPIFTWALWPGLVAVLIALSLREERQAPQPLVATVSAPLASRARWSDLPQAFRQYLVGWAIFSMANSSDVFLLMKAKQESLSLSYTILIYCFYNLVYAFFSPIFGHLSDRWGRKPVLLGGLLAFALVYLGFAASRQAWHFWLLFSIYGLHMAAMDGVGKALAVDLIDSERKATGLGWLGLVSGLSALVASVTAGVLWDRVGPAATFLFGCLGAIMAIPVIEWLPKRPFYFDPSA